MKPCMFMLVVLLSLLLTACGSRYGNSSTPPATYTIGGIVSGLSGTGLVLQNNGGNNLSISADGTFTFTAPVGSGAAYNVTVVAQPSNPVQTCNVTNGSGTATANVNGIQVNCTTVTFTVGGVVSGLTGTSTGLSLTNNGDDTTTVNASGAFTFDQTLGTGSTYAVSVTAQPTGQTCVVTNGSGTVTNSNVTNVQVTCAPNTYSIGGTIYGLSGAGLVLQDDGGDNLPVSLNGNFTFATKIDYGNPYAVSVLIQPSNPTQSCRIPNGAGTVPPNVTAIQVVCVNGNGTTNVWTWESGSNQKNDGGSYGSLGVSAPTNLPPSRGRAVPWKDTAGNFWIFGGTTGVVGSSNYLNDLWKYSAGEWTWMNGSNLEGQAGSYGTLGVAAPSNVPQARGGSAHWTDAAGNFWLFGGFGYFGSNDLSGSLSDLWQYSPSTGQWTWMGGPQGYNQAAVYGVMGAGAPGNIPGPRENSASWTDAAGNFWLFGGFGIDSTGTLGDLNDIWKYDGTQWTWVGGSDLAAQPAVYGVQGIPSPSNTPGDRDGAVVWTDASGNVWLFGGEPDSINETFYDFNDLWEYSAGQWTWVGGSNQPNQAGSYGILGIASSSNIPGPRDGAVSWTDTAGNFWLFGGEDNLGNTYDDLWEYSAGQWTWVSGSNACCQSGVYGTLGTPALTNVPGARFQATPWIDSSGVFWLFGGSDSGNFFGVEFNDLWKYQP